MAGWGVLGVQSLGLGSVPFKAKRSVLEGRSGKEAKASGLGFGVPGQKQPEFYLKPKP